MSCTFARLSAVILTMVAVTGMSATPASAQELVASTSLLTLRPSDAPSASGFLFPLATGATAMAESSSNMAPDFSRLRRPALLPALYAVTAVTQLLDAHSTMAALGNGAREANPVMQGVATHGGALLAVKAGAAIGTVFVAEKMWRRNRAGAIATMVLVNAVTGAIAAHNYSVASRLH
jgi:hypothetical protein